MEYFSTGSGGRQRRTETKQELQAALRISMEPTALSVGARVKFFSPLAPAKARAQWRANGVEGEVLEFDASAGRWKIHLHTVVLALKASNLVRRRRRNLLARALARAHHGAFLSCENLTAFLAPVAGTYDVRPFSHRSIGLSPGLPAGG